LYHKNKRHKRDLETLVESERHAHKVQQAALAGRLKRSNAALKEQIDTKQVMDLYTISATQHGNTRDTYEEELICQHILALCSDKKNPIKSTVPISAYADIALNDMQKAQLKDAAKIHYSSFFEKLRLQYPELKEKDLQYCYLCLLGLDNTQIAVMLHHSVSTIWERENRLKRILGSDNRVSVTLRVLMMH
jgi:DNA-binding CsgD family transcriptional regulator